MRIDAKNDYIFEAQRFLGSFGWEPTTAQVHSYLESKNRKDYIFMLFMLSDTCPVFSVDLFKESFLYKNLQDFEIEESHYIIESVKNQMNLKFYDFFLIMHWFFEKSGIFSENSTSKSAEVFESLFLFLMEKFDYKIREFIISGHLDLLNIKKAMENKTRLFHLKLMKKLLECDNDILIDHLKKLNLKITIPEQSGSKGFFKEWYQRQLKSKTISISFI